MKNDDTITLARAMVERALDALQDADTTMEHCQDLKLRHSAMAALASALEQPQVEQPLRYLDGGSRYKVAHMKTSGYCIIGLPRGLLGRWVALVDATDNKHIDSHPQPPRQPLPPQSDIPLTPEQLTVFKYGWKCSESAHGIGGEA